MLSLTSEYALRAMICLTHNIDEWPLAGKRISEEAGVPRKYLSKVMGDLVRAGILASAPGPGGGFRMLRSPKQVYLIEVLGLFEPVLTNRRSCPFGNLECGEDSPCAGHERWKKVKETYSRFLEETSVYDVSVKQQKRATRGKRKGV